VRDVVMMQVLMALWVANRKVYGAHKLWKAALGAGHGIGRDQVARLMREMGIEGVSRRRKKVFTTVSDRDVLRAPDLVNRNFTADRPDALWVTDLTYVPTRSGMAYVCFIVDAFSRRVVGWRVASHMRTGMVLDALEMARRSRGGRRLVGLVAHADAGSQFTSVRFTERLAEIGARPSIGTVADSYDNALAESVGWNQILGRSGAPGCRRLASYPRYICTECRLFEADNSSWNVDNELRMGRTGCLSRQQPGKRALLSCRVSSAWSWCSLLIR
jgi:putative transposase